MSTVRSRPWLLGALSLAFVAVLGCPQEEEDLLDAVEAAGTIVVATDPAYPPQSEQLPNGSFEGFDIDVAREVADRLGVDLEHATPDWENVVAGNWQGRWDISIGSMTPTEPRGQVLWFTNAYYYTPASFAVHSDNTDVANPSDLDGLTVGVQAETTYTDYLEGNLDIMDGMGGGVAYEAPSGVDPREYTADTEALEALAAGEVDAVMSAQPNIQNAIDEGQPFRIVGTPAFYEPLVFALDQSRGDSDGMLAELNEIVAEMHDDGTLTELSNRWYGIDITTPVEPE